MQKYAKVLECLYLYYVAIYLLIGFIVIGLGVLLFKRRKNFKPNPDYQYYNLQRFRYSMGSLLLIVIGALYILLIIAMQFNLI